MMAVYTYVRHESYAEGAHPENQMGAPFVSLNARHSDICAVVTVEIDLIGSTTQKNWTLRLQLDLFHNLRFLHIHVRPSRIRNR